MQRSDQWRAHNTKPMADRQIDQLIGLAQGIVADGIVSQAEAEALQRWLRANVVTESPRIIRLLEQVERVLEDGVLDQDEARDLHDALMTWTGAITTDGEESKTAPLPLDPEPRLVQVPGNIFVFTGTGIFGTRTMMQDATARAGGTHAQNVTLKTNYVVLGTYVTPAWAHQSFGRKIERAMRLRDERGTGLRIVQAVQNHQDAVHPSSHSSRHRGRHEP